MYWRRHRKPPLIEASKPKNKKYVPWNAGIFCLIENCFPTQNFTEIGLLNLLNYGRKMIFNTPAVCHLEFKKMSYLVTWLSWSSKSAILYQISSKSLFFVEIRQFNDFQDGGRPPCWIFEIWSLSRDLYIAVLFASPCKISLKSDNRLLSYGKKNNFQYGGCHLVF